MSDKVERHLANMKRSGIGCGWVTLLAFAFLYYLIGRM